MKQLDFNSQLTKVLAEISENVAVIQSRLTSLEENAISRIEIVQLRSDLRKIETKVAAVDGHVNQIANKLDKKFVELFDHLDGDVMEQRQRLKEVERRLGVNVA